jgi:hypothetical protein
MVTGPRDRFTDRKCTYCAHCIFVLIQYGKDLYKGRRVFNITLFRTLPNIGSQVLDRIFLSTRSCNQTHKVLSDVTKAAFILLLPRLLLGFLIIGFRTHIVQPIRTHNLAPKIVQLFLGSVQSDSSVKKQVRFFLLFVRCRCLWCIFLSLF